jgi:ribosomal protein S27E
MNTNKEYGKVTCGDCGKDTTMDKVVWSDPKMTYVCQDCTEIKIKVQE